MKRPLLHPAADWGPRWKGGILLPLVFVLVASSPRLVHAHSDGTNVDGDAKGPAIRKLQLPAQRPPSTALPGKAPHQVADSTIFSGQIGGAPAFRIQPAPSDPNIQHALAQISPAQIEQTISKLVSFGNRNTLSSMESDLPPAQGVNAAADWVEAELRRYSAGCGGCLEVHRDTFTEPAQTGASSRFPQATMITNVYAILRGSDPMQAKRMYLVTGHYDSRGTDVLDTHKPAPGANDDASGVAVSLECARVLSKLHFPATLVFVAVAGEEQGLNGSAHLAHLARTEGWQLEGVLNNDIVGGDTTPGDHLQDKFAVRVFSEGIPAAATPQEIRALTARGGESDSPSRELARAVADVAGTYFKAANSHPDAAKAGGTIAGRLGGALVPENRAGANSPRHSQRPAFHPVLEFRRDRFHRGGDHTSFNKEGFAAVRFTEWRENFNHQHQDLRTEDGVEYGDLLKFVDFQYVAKVARLNAATLATLAAAPPPPQAVMIENEDLNNDSTLRWNAPSGFEATRSAQGRGLRYEVVWRATAAPDWEFARTWDASGVSESVTLPVSKDNFIFGVRSIDAAGHRSLVVIPTAEQ